MYAGVTHRGQHWTRRRFTRIVDNYRHFPGYWGNTTVWAWILDFRQASRLPTIGERFPPLPSSTTARSGQDLLGLHTVDMSK